MNVSLTVGEDNGYTRKFSGAKDNDCTQSAE